MFTRGGPLLAACHLASVFFAAAELSRELRWRQITIKNRTARIAEYNRVQGRRTGDCSAPIGLLHSPTGHLARLHSLAVADV